MRSNLSQDLFPFSCNYFLCLHTKIDSLLTVGWRYLQDYKWLSGPQEIRQHKGSICLCGSASHVGNVSRTAGDSLAICVGITQLLCL
jgi:hypothetical protein